MTWAYERMGFAGTRSLHERRRDDGATAIIVFGEVMHLTR